MLRDASHRQVIQKFSFIDRLSLSRAKNSCPQSNLDQLNTDRAFNFQQAAQQDQSLAIANSQPAPQDQGTMVATAEMTTTIDQNWYQTANDYSLSLAEIINTTTNEHIQPRNNSAVPQNYLGKILFALACSYGLFVIWWLFGHQGSNLVTTLRGGKNLVLSHSDIQFIDYLERSLGQIDRQIVAQNKNNEDVVYVPVYTPNPAKSTVASNNVPPSSFPRSNAPTVAVPPTPQPLAIPAPPPLPDPTPIINHADSNVKPSVIANQPSKVPHTLIGVLELGADRSAALVRVKGKTRRVWVGEKIHTDGWILESVGEQQATIQHQGEVRSISVGETF